jgi:hypothetical protein
MVTNITMFHVDQHNNVPCSACAVLNTHDMISRQTYNQRNTKPSVCTDCQQNIYFLL